MSELTILDYEVHNNIVDHHAFMSAFKNFAQGEGWTVQTWEQNCQWGDSGGGVYDFISGTEDFLELRSTGYGSQTMQFRFRQENTGTGYSRQLRYGGFHGTVGYDSASATHPYALATGSVAKWNTYGSIAISADTMPAVWFFGNEKFILSVVKYDLTYVQAFAFGSLELNDDTDVYGEYLSYLATSDITWESKSCVNLFDYINLAVYWNGAAQAYPTGVRYNFYTGTGKASYYDDSFISYGRLAITENKYSGRRPIVPQEIFVKDTGDGQWQHLGRHWVGRLQHDGLRIGEVLTYGSEQYVTFPYRTVGVDTVGFAVRIA